MYPAQPHRVKAKQRGAALLVMLVIMIIGVAAILVSSLNGSSLQIARDKTTAAALAQAKEALIGRAVADLTSPGSLPCPDTNDDGSAELLSGNDCPSYIGRLPWKTLGLPDLRDGSGERLWYALSPNFRDDNSNPINSNSVGTLVVYDNSGVTLLTPPSSEAIAIVFAPGDIVASQQRDAANQNSPQNYLDLGPNSRNNAIAAGPFIAADKTNFFNDRLMIIRTGDLIPTVEMRIAREAKSCLDNYAVSSAGKYPWAVPVSDTTGYTGVKATYFGRLSTQPSNITSSTNDPSVDALLNALSALHIALNNYAANNSSSTRTALDNAGVTLVNAANTVKNAQPTSPAVSTSITSPAKNAGNLAQNLAGGSGSVTAVQTKINSTNSALTSAGISSAVNDPTMSTTWPSSCTLFTSSYWSAWQNLVFYQAAYGYQPGGSASCVAGGCLSISGSGNTATGSGTYRAAVLVARRAIGTENRSNPATIMPYLEGSNPHSGLTPTTTFETYNSSDSNYSTVNDLVLCLDGKNYCKR